VLAVASLAELSCIILAEGVTLDEETVSVAKEKEINILSSSLSTYETAKKLFPLI
jgi:serine kinase of HPr protein (carbohydrate metabolism regulator)